MMIIVGFFIAIGLVMLGYILSGGKMSIITHALPYEGMMIFGASFGAFVIANSFSAIKATGKSIVRVFKGAKWRRSDYADLLKLLYELCKIYRVKGLSKLEEHIENTDGSDVFQRYPRISRDKVILATIVDAFRLLALQLTDPHKMEEALDKKIEAQHEEDQIPAHSLTSVADGLPAIGIVVAVLGVIKTMSAVSEPPAVLGALIGGALVGTFLGVYLAYCLVAPIANRLNQILKQDLAFSFVIRDVIVAMVSGDNANICVEIGRGNIPPTLKPSFEDLEESIKSVGS